MMDIALVLPLLQSVIPEGAVPIMGPMIFSSLFFAGIVAALFFMIAYFLQSPPMKAVANEELAAFFLSIFIILFWLTSDAFFNGITIGLLGGGLPAGYTIPPGLSSAHMDFAIATTGIFISKIKHLYFSLYLYEILIGFLSTISFPFGMLFAGPAIVSFSFMPFASLGMLSAAQTSVVEATGLLAAALYAKEFILLFFRDAVPLLLLPLGIVLRAFPFSRTTGSSLIAVCFAGYFVLPMAVLFSHYVIFDLYDPAELVYTPSVTSPFRTSMTGDDLEEFQEGAKDSGKSLQEQYHKTPVAQEVATKDECAGNEILCGSFKIIKGIWDAAASLFKTVWTIWLFMMGFMGDFFWSAGTNPIMPTSSSAGLFHFIVREVEHVSQFIVVVMIMTVIEIIITLTMYRNIAMLIGGEAELAGITKLV